MRKDVGRLQTALYRRRRRELMRADAGLGFTGSTWTACMCLSLAILRAGVTAEPQTSTVTV